MNESISTPSGSTAGTPPTQGTGGPSEPEIAPQVRKLIEAGKAKQAVELAREFHKKHPSAGAEALAVEAYLARIAQFQAKGMLEDANTLLKLVQDRYPSSRARLGALQWQTSVAEGKIDAVVAPLARADVAADVREGIETALRRELADPRLLANCAVLPADHPLRTSAAAVWQALVAVTSGEVTDERIALLEVPRRSPLAGWKLLIRAIAAFYRKDVEGMNRALDAIPADAAARRVAPILHAIIEHKPAGTGKAAALATKIVSDDATLREALNNIESALSRSDSRLLSRSIRAVRCRL